MGYNRKSGENSRVKVDSQQNLRKSIEKDRSVNLEHWRKEAFRYQERVFAMEKEVTQLKQENSSLRT